MTSAIATMPERTERTRVIAGSGYASRFHSESDLPSPRRLKLERIMRTAPKTRRSVCISTKRMARIDPDGQQRTYFMEFYPPERRMIETSPDGTIAEYTFDFAKWRAFARTNKLQSRLLHMYYRDIFGNPDRPSMDFDQLAKRYNLDHASIGHLILEAERAVCGFKLLKNRE
jgi:hypothetical protein